MNLVPTFRELQVGTPGIRCKAFTLGLVDAGWWGGGRFRCGWSVSGMHELVGSRRGGQGQSLLALKCQGVRGAGGERFSASLKV